MNYDTVDQNYTADLQSLIEDGSTKYQGTDGTNNPEYSFFYVLIVDYTRALKNSQIQKTCLMRVDPYQV